MTLKTTLLAAACLLATATSAMAYDNAYYGQVQTFALEFCPKGWLPADGRRLSIRDNMALFSLLGTRFGGDGQNYFELPDLQQDTPDKLPPNDKGHRFKLLWCIRTDQGAVFPARP